MMTPIISIDSTVMQLREMFDIINKNYYDGELLRPEINICVLHGVHSRFVYKCYESFNKKNMSEISINRNYVSPGNEENVFLEILKCCVLYYCKLKHIKGTSNEDIYFNKKFKSVAESHGLVSTGRNKYGYKKYALSNDSICIVSSGMFAFTISGDTYTYGKNGGYKNHYRKYICPLCGCNVRATKSVNLICADCNTNMELQQ